MHISNQNSNEAATKNPIKAFQLNLVGFSRGMFRLDKGVLTKPFQVINPLGILLVLKVPFSLKMP